MSMNLSKSRYTAGVLCSNALWLKEHKPESFDESTINQSVLDTAMVKVWMKLKEISTGY